MSRYGDRAEIEHPVKIRHPWVEITGYLSLKPAADLLRLVESRYESSGSMLLCIKLGGLNPSAHIDLWSSFGRKIVCMARARESPARFVTSALAVFLVGVSVESSQTVPPVHLRVEIARYRSTFSLVLVRSMGICYTRVGIVRYITEAWNHCDSWICGIYCSYQPRPC